MNDIEAQQKQTICVIPCRITPILLFSTRKLMCVVRDHVLYYSYIFPQICFVNDSKVKPSKDYKEKLLCVLDSKYRKRDL